MCLFHYGLTPAGLHAAAFLLFFSNSFIDPKSATDGLEECDFTRVRRLDFPSPEVCPCRKFSFPRRVEEVVVRSSV